MFQKILIANRGEIACRVIRTARKMGIRTVAVYSEADKNARHVELADESVCIGPPASKESYLAMDKIIAACKQTGAEAVHPGYGFLSENEEFSRRLEQQGITFIGPKHESIAAMGDKIASKKLARDARVNTIPGYNDPIEIPGASCGDRPQDRLSGDDQGLRGWRRPRLARRLNDKEAAEGFTSCQAEAKTAFGDDRVFIEKFVEEPRHIEIQVLGDAHGNVVYLWERECSIQRRHQKVIEEAPSPFLDDATRRAMGEQAVALAMAVRYQSAGTVEFVVGKDMSFYFLEMNTRLQVEHPVTEFITGLDIVELMIRVAAGEPLPFTQEQVRREGWAIECRINAEDPFRNFLPSTGRLVRFIPPEQVPGSVRVDTGVYEGDEIPIHYDSMIAKLITHGATRAQAITRMHDALNGFVIRGISSNLAFQSALSRHPRFMAGDFNTGFIAEEFPKGFHPSTLIHEDPLLLASVAAYARRRYIHRAVRITGQLKGHERRVGNEWVVLMQGQRYHLTVNLVQGGCDFIYEGESACLRTNWKLGEILLRGTWKGNKICVQVERMGLKYRVMHWGTQVDAIVMTGRAAELLALMPDKPPPDLSRFLLSPMPGLLTQITVKPGQEVRAGENLVVIEAMKMQNILKAENDGTVAEVMAKPGDSLAVDQPIIKFK